MKALAIMMHYNETKLPHARIAKDHSKNGIATRKGGMFHVQQEDEGSYKKKKKTKDTKLTTSLAGQGM